MLFPKINSISALISFITIFGVLAHCLHLEGLVQKNDLFSDAKTEKLASSQHTHVETSSYSSETFGLRSHPLASRPENDADKDSTLKKRLSSDGFGNDYSSWAI